MAKPKPYRHYVYYWKATGGRYVQCGEDIPFGLYDRLGDHKQLTERTHETTCPDCIEAYETEPQPATTKDLAEAVRLIRGLAMVVEKEIVLNHAKAFSVALRALERRLARPRSIKDELVGEDTNNDGDDDGA